MWNSNEATSKLGGTYKVYLSEQAVADPLLETSNTELHDDVDIKPLNNILTDRRGDDTTPPQINNNNNNNNNNNAFDCHTTATIH